VTTCGIHLVVGGVTFAEYRGSYNGTDFIPAGEAYLIPQGIPKLFITRFAPADYAEGMSIRWACRFMQKVSRAAVQPGRDD
jgi:hypothetical protein